MVALSISAITIPASDAVQLLLSSLADESQIVREASAASLKDIASLNPSLVLECCSAACRGGRRSFGNMAGLFQVMAIAVQSMDKRDAEQSLMEKLAKTATTEIVSSKELNADWQKAASALLVSIGSHFPDLLMEEVFVHFTAPPSALPAMVQVLADFASTDALQFAPRLKAVLSRVLPVLGNVRDAHRPIIANALGCWCQAVFQPGMDFQTQTVLDSDVISFLNSAFELILRVWAFSRDKKVKLSSVGALGQMVSVVTRAQLKLRIPALVHVMLELYKGDQESTFLATCCLHNFLNAVLLSESGPPMLDFEEVTVILSTLLTVVCIHNDINHHSSFSLGLKTYNEVQHCFMVVGFIYPEDLFLFLLSKCRLKEEYITFGALCVLKHLLPRFFEVWHNKRSTLTETARLLLDEQSLGIQMALSELIVVMASHSYLVDPFMEMFIEHLVCNCSRKIDKDEEFSSSSVIARHKRMDVKITAFSSRELRTICKNGLLLLAVTIPEMEDILWPFLLKLIMPSAFTDAVATVCRCICELCRRKANSSISVHYEGMVRSDIPTSEELFARLLVLLHDPAESDQIAMHILSALYYLAPRFPKNVKLLWRDEIPKLKVYIGDAEELKLNPSFQETWDDMIIDFLAETLDVIDDATWLISLGNVFAKHYDLYAHDDEHCALLHRCFGMLLQKVGDKAYVHNMVDWMYKQADISCSINRLGLAKGMGLVAASHLDTVLDKLKDILEGMGQSILKRIMSFFYDRKIREYTDEVHAALALMYGYAARYAPSAVIEARIDALVGTDMLSHLLHVRHPTAKQALITAINLLGLAVINAKESGYPFPLKRRDMLLDYVLTLMGGDEITDSSESSTERLHTQTIALSACTTLVSVQPKLSIETRNHVMKATFSFFVVPNDPLHSVNLLVENLITLFCAILDTSREDGGSRVEYFLYILRQIDRFLSSSFNHQRRRGCMVAHALLVKFRSYCTSGYGHDRVRGLPCRATLCLGERIMVYLPRCADTDADVRKLSVEILNLFFNISLSLPKPADLDLELSYDALSSLEDVVAIVRSDASIDSSEVFNRVISSVGLLLSKDELVATLHGCAPAICDRIKQSAEGSVQAVTEFVSRRGPELGEADISKTVQSLLSATAIVNEKDLRQEILATISAVAENTSSGIVFHEVLSAAGRDLVTKDISRMLGGWPLQEVFCAFSQHNILSVPFLEYLVSILCCAPALIRKPGEEGTSTMDQIMQASVIGMTAFFRGGGKVGRKAVERNYSSILTTLLLQFGNCHGLASLGRLEPLLDLRISFQAFCECVGDFEMGKVLARDCDDAENENWLGIVGDIASCISLKRTKEVSPVCLRLKKHLTNPLLCDAAAAALSEFIHYSRGLGSVLDEMVEALCQHASCDSPTIRRFCVRGLTKIPSADISTYSSQIIQVILASLQDSSESVELAGISCLLLVFDFLTKDAIKPYIFQLYRQVCNLQASIDPTIRANAFAAFGTLSSCRIEENLEDFVELVHSSLPCLILHLGDEDPAVCKACQSSLMRIASQIEWKELGMLDSISFESDCRSDYEKFIRDLIRKSSRQFALRFEKYIAVAMQAFDAPWPIIQANAVYFASSILSISHEEQIIRAYFTEIFGMLVDKLNRSSDAVVRAACSSAIASLMKSLKLSFPRSA